MSLDCLLSQTNVSPILSNENKSILSLLEPGFLHALHLL